MIHDIVNLCRHPVTIAEPDGALRYFSGTFSPARVLFQQSRMLFTADGIPVHAPPLMLGVDNLPPFDPERLLVVSRLTAIAAAHLLPERTDLVYPGSGIEDDPIRLTGSRGIDGVRALIRVAGT